MKPSDEQELNEREIARRADAAIKRALNTPHKPHKPLKAKKKTAKKSKKRER